MGGPLVLELNVWGDNVSSNTRQLAYLLRHIVRIYMQLGVGLMWWIWCRAIVLGLVSFSTVVKRQTLQTSLSTSLSEVDSESQLYLSH